MKDNLETGDHKLENSGVQFLMNKFFLSIEILRNYIERIEKENEKIYNTIKIQEKAIEDLKGENNVLREVIFCACLFKKY